MRMLYKKTLIQEHVEPKGVTHVKSINIIYAYIIYFSKSQVLLKKGIEFCQCTTPRKYNTRFYSVFISSQK